MFGLGVARSNLTPSPPDTFTALHPTSSGRNFTAATHLAGTTVMSLHCNSTLHVAARGHHSADPLDKNGLEQILNVASPPPKRDAPHPGCDATAATARRYVVWLSCSPVADSVSGT